MFLFKGCNFEEDARPPPPNPFGDPTPRWVSTDEVKQHVKLRSTDATRLDVSQRPSLQRNPSGASDGTGDFLPRTRSLAPTSNAHMDELASALSEPSRRASSFDSSNNPNGDLPPSDSLRDIFFGSDPFASPGSVSYGGDGEASDVQSIVSSSRAYVQDDVEYKVGWQYDDESASCMCCDKEFTVLRRRHHCRMCGVLVCVWCSDYRLPVKGLKPGTHRVCIDCFKTSEHTPRMSAPQFLFVSKPKAAAQQTRPGATAAFLEKGALAPQDEEKGPRFAAPLASPDSGRTKSSEP